MWDIKKQKDKVAYLICLFYHIIYIYKHQKTPQNSLYVTQTQYSHLESLSDGIVPVRQTRKAIVQKIAFVIERT